MYNTYLLNHKIRFFFSLSLGGKRLAALSSCISTVFLLPLAILSYFTQVSHTVLVVKRTSFAVQLFLFCFDSLPIFFVKVQVLGFRV